MSHSCQPRRPTYLHKVIVVLKNVKTIVMTMTMTMAMNFFYLVTKPIIKA